MSANIDREIQLAIAEAYLRDMGDDVVLEPYGMDATQLREEIKNETETGKRVLSMYLRDHEGCKRVAASYIDSMKPEETFEGLTPQQLREEIEKGPSDVFNKLFSEAQKRIDPRSVLDLMLDRPSPP